MCLSVLEVKGIGSDNPRLRKDKKSMSKTGRGLVNLFDTKKRRKVSESQR